MSDANTRVTVPADQLRRAFAHRLSTMFGREVPLYGLLVQTVMEHNREVLARNPGLGVGLDIEALSAERHGAIRLARPAEMRQVAGMFRVLGMHPVGFYDLTRAPNGKRQPVISTAFRPVRIQELERAPFRMFASLLCVDDVRFFPPDLSRRIQEHVRDRRIMSPALDALIARYDADGGLTVADAETFLDEAVAVFAWNPQQSVPADLYGELLQRAPIAADVILEPHLNHLTPRSLDIDGLHERMAERAEMKDRIEGPPARAALVFLRQTSYKALAEERDVESRSGTRSRILHRARFGEVEQRGVAMTPKGRALYDQAINAVASGADPERAFAIIPDDHDALRSEGLAYYRYVATAVGLGASSDGTPADLEGLVQRGYLRAQPIRYEDFLPVSAAGIFGSNLDGGVVGDTDEGEVVYGASDLEGALGCPILDPEALYAAQRARSIAQAYALLGRAMPPDLALAVSGDLRRDPRPTGV